MKTVRDNPQNLGGGVINNDNYHLDNNLSEIRKNHYKELVELMPYNDKILWAKTRVKEFLTYLKEHHYKEVLVSFSGGKDSTVLLDIVLKVHQEMKSDIYIIPAYAYEITFPETLSFINNTIDKYRNKYKYLKELYLAKPKKPWMEILQEYGYPIFSKQISVSLNRVLKVKSKNGITKWLFGHDTARFKLSKNRLFLLDKKMKQFPKMHEDYFGLLDNNYIYSEKCCNLIKGGLKNIKIPSFVGTMASESEFRKTSWIKNGCNVLNSKHLLSRPLSIFTNKDIWLYLYKNTDIVVNPKYNFIRKENVDESTKNLKYHRLGCISCPYGAHRDKSDKNRFQILKEESEILYKSQVIKNGMYKVIIDMGIKIPEDKKYTELYEARWQMINDWYNNLEENLADVITQIENYKNYKKYKPIKNKEVEWIYTNDEIYEFYRNYDLETSNKTIDKLIQKYRAKRIKGE